MARGRPRSVPAALCQQHKTANVVSLGTRKTNAGLTRRYQCTPAVGKKHTFTVAVDEKTGLVQPRVWTPPPACTKHPDSKVVRAGVYGTRTPKPRQLYQCSPLDGSKPHRFTPALPRDHVHTFEGGCVHCEELRGFHHGETAIARTHSWPTRIVVLALDELSRGASYGETSRTALQRAELAAQRHDELLQAGLDARAAAQVVDAELAGAAVPLPLSPSSSAAGATPSGSTGGRGSGRYRRQRRSKVDVDADKASAAAIEAAKAAGATPEERAAAGDAARDAVLAKAAAAAEGRRPRNPRTAEANNSWHIAADWVEAFSPVLYEPLHTRLLEQALAERARLDELRSNGERLERPQVVLLDDVPVYGRDPDTGKSRHDAGYYLLRRRRSHLGR